MREHLERLADELPLHEDVADHHGFELRPELPFPLSAPWFWQGDEDTDPDDGRFDTTRHGWLKGHIEAIPLPAETVAVVLSNCMINLSTDKPQVLRETARVLKPGGRFAVSDVIADPGMDDTTRRHAAVRRLRGRRAHRRRAHVLPHRGWADRHRDIETHRVHEHAGSAIVRARKPPDPSAA